MRALDRPYTLESERFEVRGKLGAGSMGVVYRVLDRRLGRDVAMKTLRHAAGLYRFKREFRALADIVHPNLVALHELHTQADEWFFTMELVEGCAFIDWVRPSTAARLPEPDEDTLPSMGGAPLARAGIVLAQPKIAVLREALPQLADGVHALHVSGKLHRDLKPSNVLVDRSGRVVLLDFGLVSELCDAAGVIDRTHDQVIAGTPAYMSPEQAADQPLTEASDWYAVGVMLYEALTGRRPFEGASEEIMRRKQEEDPRPPRALFPDAPEDLDRLCVSLLARDPRARPEGRAVLAALNAAASTHTRDLARFAQSQAFVGRQHELEALHRALADARQRAVAIFVVGESGMGKTQLVRKFLDEVGDAALIIEGRCYERESVPYKTLDTAVDALVTRLMTLSPERLDEVLPDDLAALGRLFPVLRRVRSIVARTIGQDVPPDPQELRRRGFAALRELLRRFASLAPLVFCIDDLQWGDADSAVFLADLIHRPEPLPLLLVLVHRPHDDGGVVAQVRRGTGMGQAGSDLRTIDVGPLSVEEASELVVKVGGDTLDGAEAVIREAGGHPLFLTELARETARGTSPTLDALLRTRVESLEVNAASLLSVLAVAGRPVRLDDAVRAAGGASGVELGRLRAERLVRVRRVGDDAAASLEPYHDRVRQAVLGAMTPRSVRRIHRSLAETIEARGPGPRDLDCLVDHWKYAGEPARAMIYAVRAAEVAEEMLAFHRAAELYAHALEHAAPAATERRRLMRRRADALVNAGHLEEAARAYQAAADGAPEHERLDLDRLRLEQILRRGHLDEGLALAADVLHRIGYRLPPSQASAVRTLVWGRIQLRVRGRAYREQRAAEVDPDQLQRVDILQSIASGLSFVDAMRGRVMLTHLMHAALDVGEPERVCRALCHDLAHPATIGVKGRRRVDEQSALARDLAARLGVPYLRGLAELSTGIAGFLTGRWRVACDLIASGTKLLRDHGNSGRWEIDIGELFHTAAMFYAGDVKEMARTVPLLLRDAVERGDVYAQHGLRGWRSNMAWLIRGEPVDARAHVVAVATPRAPHEGYSLHRYYEMLSHSQIDLYLRDGESARARVAEARRPMARALLTRIQTVRVELEFLAARAAIMTAIGCGDGDERRRLFAEARRSIKALDREGASWATGLARLSESMVVWASGDGERAAAYLDVAERALDEAGLVLFVQIARLRRGEIVGGPGGAARARDAFDWLRDNGVADPAAFAQLLAPTRR